MTEGETTRLIVWSTELRRVHGRLREALEVVRATIDHDSVDGGTTSAAAGRDLLLFCHGFCTALAEHHEGEDRGLFPAVAAAHPELTDVLRALQQDHSMIAHLVGQLQAALTSGAPVADVDRHIDGIGAIMESHFRYEERQLLTVLETLALDADPDAVLGTL